MSKTQAELDAALDRIKQRDSLPYRKERHYSDHACLLEIHRTVHSWADVPVINEHDQWTVKRVKELLLAYQTATKEAA